MHLSTGVKPTTGASKSMPKKVTQINRSFPAQDVRGKRVEAHTRKLNKTNRVDSSLNYKNNGFVSNSIAVCKMCNGCLFSVNHDQCVVRYLKSVNAKTPKAKHVVTHTKQVWRAKKPTRKPTKKPTTRTEWRPTSHTFSLFKKCPLTRIVEPNNELVDHTNKLVLAPTFLRYLDSLIVTLMFESQLQRDY